MQVNLKKKNLSFITVHVIFSEKRQAISLSSLYEWYVSFSTGNMTTGSHDQPALRFIAALVFNGV